jgi:hypothetical protein
MADEELIRGIIGIDVQAGDVAGQIAQVLDSVRQQFIEAVSGIPGFDASVLTGDVGRQLTSINELIGGIERLKIAMAEASGEFGRQGQPVGAAFMDAKIAQMDEVLGRARELETFQQHVADVSKAQYPGVQTISADPNEQIRAESIKAQQQAEVERQNAAIRAQEEEIRARQAAQAPTETTTPAVTQTQQSVTERAAELRAQLEAEKGSLTDVAAETRRLSAALVELEGIEANAARAVAQHAVASNRLAQGQEVGATGPSPSRLAMEGNTEGFLGTFGVDPEASIKLQRNQLDQSILVAKREQLLNEISVIGESGDRSRQEARLAALAKVELQIKEKLVAAEALQAQEAEAGGAGSGGRGKGFFAGFAGTYGVPGAGGGSDLIEQAGFAAKYYAFYQVFAFGEKLISETRKQTEEYTLAVNQLSIALGVNYEKANQVAQGYGEIGTQLATAPATAVRGAVQFQRAFPGDPNAGRTGAQLASQINLLETDSTRPLGAEEQERLRQALVAITENYAKAGVSSAQLAKTIYDEATSVAQSYQFTRGGDLLPGFAQIADLTKEGGFSQQQGLALVASVMQQTGGTSEDAAGDLKRFLGRSGQNTFQQLFTQFGIDSNQTLKQELDDLSAKFQKLNEDQQRTIISTFGGGRAGAAVAALLNDLPRQEAAAQKATGDVGIVDKQSDQRLQTFAGRIEKLTADFSTFAKDLGQSGIGDTFGLIIGAVDEGLQVLDKLLQLFNSLPSPIRETAGALGLIVLALKAIAAAQGEASISGVLSGFSGGLGIVGPRAALAANAANRAAADAALTGAEGALAGTALARPGVARGVALAAGDTAAVGAAEAGAAGAAAAAAKASTAVAGTTSSLGALAYSAGSAAAALGPLIAVIGGLLAFNTIANQTKKDDQRNVDDRGVLQSAGVKLPTDTRKDNYDQSLAQAATPDFSGKSYDQLIQTANQAKAAIAALHRENDSLGAGVRDVFSNLTEDKDTRKTDPGTSEGRNARIKQLEAVANAADAEAKKVEEAQARVDAAIEGSKTRGQVLFGQDYTNVSRGIQTIINSSTGASNALKILNDLIAHVPKEGLAALFDKTPGSPNIDQAIQKITTGISRSTNPLEREAGSKQLYGFAQNLQQTADASGNADFIDHANAILDQASKAYFDSAIKDVQAKIASIHALGQNNAKTQAQIRALVTPLLKEALAAGNVDAAVQLLAGVDANFINAVRRNLEAMRRILETQRDAILQAASVARAAVADAAALRAELADGANIAGPTAAPGSDVVAAANAQKLAAAKAAAIGTINTQLKTLNTAISLSAPSGSDFAFPKDKQGPTGPTPEQIELARIEATAIPGDPLQNARVALRAARYQLSTAKNSLEYYQALKELRQAQYELGMQELAYANTRDLLRIDITDPVARAREKVREDIRQLNYDRRRGATGDVLAKDALALKEDQASAQRSAFDQKFNDEQTNYELNRISLTSYLNYLQSQHDYLTAVKHKTRDQIDELNQVDRALKSLRDGLDGQFNLGEIKVPSPYEVRRAIAAGSGAGTNNTVTTYITISGADNTAVRAVLTEYLGQQATQTTGTTTVKV